MTEREKILEYYDKLGTTSVTKDTQVGTRGEKRKIPEDGQRSITDQNKEFTPDNKKRSTSVLVKKRFTLSEGCRSSDHYKDLKKIGEGTYGAVYMARCRETNELMALKKLKLEHETEGFPITSIRETITLLKGKHPNVIDVREIVFGNRLDEIYIVMEYMDRDLRSLMRVMERPFTIPEAKLLMKQLLSAINHLHNNWILHRDLKTSNLLINKGVLKVGDFGLAREYGSPLRQYTNKVVTLWYRAPELLLQTGKYSTPVDIWSIGCIFGELLTARTLFEGSSEANQLERIFETLGSPNEELWPDYEKIRLVRSIKFNTYKFNRLLEKLPDRKLLTDKGFHFWNKLLAYDPGVRSGEDEKFVKRSTHRITAEAALEHEFFKEEPKPLHPDLFPTWPAKTAMEKHTCGKHEPSSSTIAPNCQTIETGSIAASIASSIGLNQKPEIGKNN